MDTIGLYKIDYEITGKENEGALWSCGVLAYNQEEAVKTLADFLKKPFKCDTLSFQGACHAISQPIRDKVIAANTPKTKPTFRPESDEATPASLEELVPKKQKRGIVPAKESE
jgi:hypothetical protein